MPKVLVKVIDKDEIVKEITCETQRKAEKVVLGLNRNLHSDYYTTIED